MPTFQRLARRSIATALAVAALSACTEGTGPESLGQLRLRPVFASGEEPEALGIALSQIRIVLRRSDGAVVADTSLPYVSGETTSWLVDLRNSPESVGVSADIGQGAATLYTGSGQVSLPAGIGPSSTQHDLLVRYVSGPSATFSIDISPDSAGLQAPGDTRQFSAIARDSSGGALTGFVFSWASSSPGVATVNATTGLVTAVAPGRTEITATSGGVVGSAVVTVGAGVPTTVVVTPDTSALSIGGSIQFHALAFDAFDRVVSGVVFTWSSSHAAVASVASSGVSTALAAGQTRIIASLGSLADSAVLTVIDSAGTGGIASIVVTPGAALLTSLGSTQQFSAVAFDAKGNVLPGVAFQWTSSSIVASVDGTGLATALATGVTTITASANGVTGTASLRVSVASGSPVRIIVVPGTTALSLVGATQQYIAIMLDAQDRAVPNVVFTWASSDPSVASVTTSGLATSVGHGTATITASAAGLTGSASLTVTLVVASVSVAPAAATVATGDSTTFTAVARDANGHVIVGAVFIWSTTTPSTATVSSAGVATGISSGTTLVSAMAGGVTGTGTLSVIDVGSIEIQGLEEQYVTVGGTRQFTAVVRDVAGNVVSGIGVTWSVGNPAVATIDSVTGTATGLHAGITFVRARAGTRIDEVELVVRP